MLDPDQTIMIGDRITDIDAAKYMNIRSVWVNYGFGDASERNLAKPDYICDSPRELRAFLNTI